MPKTLVFTSMFYCFINTSLNKCCSIWFTHDKRKRQKETFFIQRIIDTPWTPFYLSYVSSWNLKVVANCFFHSIIGCNFHKEIIFFDANYVMNNSYMLISWSFGLRLNLFLVLLSSMILNSIIMQKCSHCIYFAKRSRYINFQMLSFLIL